jgi:antitoxin (DNA-binding transcriptional repressor) of toxin-antitoxin stability system
MRFMSIRELRNQSARLQRAVEEETVTLTSNGHPFALMVGLGEDEDPAALERAVRLARAQQALSRIRRQAVREGMDRLTEAEIEAEVRASRGERSR